MVGLLIIRDYIVWHYSRALIDIFVIWRNVTRFVFHFFSIPLLLRSLFQPWKKVAAKRESTGFDPQDWIETVMVNTVMRIVGAIMRLLLIVFGLLCVGAIVLIGLQFFVLWVVLPFTLLLLLSSGITLLFI